MDEAFPQIPAIVAHSSTASMRAAWPGVLRGALRRAGVRGLFEFQLWDVLAERDIIDPTPAHKRAMSNALEYLYEVGLAHKEGAKWYEIPVHPVLPIRSEA